MDISTSVMSLSVMSLTEEDHEGGAVLDRPLTRIPFVRSVTDVEWVRTVDPGRFVHTIAVGCRGPAQQLSICKPRFKSSNFGVFVNNKYKEKNFYPHTHFLFLNTF